MKKGAVAKRYARVLIELGREGNRYREIGRELRDIAAIFAANHELKRFLLNPMYKLDDRKAILHKVADASAVSDAVRRFLTILVETRGIGIIEDVATAYSRLEDEIVGRITVTVESAAELDNGRVKEINKKLQELTGREVVLTVEKNPPLIGGLVFRIGNTILDGSIKTQLQRVRERIAQI